MMIKKLLGVIVMIFIFFIIPSNSNADSQLLQQRINNAKTGDTIEIDAGIYEKPIVIDKEVNIIGNEDVLFHIASNEPAITITANHVTLQHLSIKYSSNEDGQAAILMENSTETKLADIDIETEHLGILLDEAHNNILTNITLRGNEELPISKRQRGIDLWKSNHNTITHTNISFVEDGIYIESSYGNVVHDNIATDSRYGYHLMFTKETELFANESYENISGMMVMGTNGTQVYENILQHNQENVQSLGLLLFDVKNAHVENNDIAYNRLGIFVEDASENNIANNDVHNNFIGLQFKRAEKNNIHHNAFSANVVQGLAEESMNNTTNNNYWSDHNGLDLTGDGMSNIAYKVDPFYLHLTSKYPPYRLLFQAPGFLFLEKMMHTPTEQQLIDERPLMASPLHASEVSAENNWATIVISTILFITSLFIIYLGVKQQ